MTKIINATCENETVTADGFEVEAEILSQGKKASEGLLAIDQDKAVYITSSAEDIKKVIEDLTAIVQKVIEVATGLDAVTVSPGSQAGNIAMLTTLKAQFEVTKDNLK